MHVIPFPSRRDGNHGIVHIWGDRIQGFQVSHESASGNSWGDIQDFASGADAITAAYALNRDAYGGRCEIFVCDAALHAAAPGVGLPSVPGDS